MTDELLRDTLWNLVCRFHRRKRTVDDCSMIGIGESLQRN